MRDDFVVLKPDDPKKARRSLLIFSVVFLAVIGVFLALSANAVRFGQKNIAPQIQCDLAFENVRDAILYYAEMNGGHLPRAETWMDDLQPYLVKTYNATQNSMRSSLILYGDWGCKLDTGHQTGMAYNSELSGVAIKDIKDVKNVILLFEIENPKRNANGTYPPVGRPARPNTNWARRQWLRIGLIGYERASGSISNAPMGGR